MKKLFAIIALSLFPIFAFSNDISKFSILEKDGNVRLLHESKDYEISRKNAEVHSNNIGKSICSFTIDSTNIESVCKKFVLENYPHIDINNLKMISATLGRRQWFVNFKQVHNGLEVLNSEVKMRVFENGNLLDINAIYYENIDYQPLETIDLPKLQSVAVSGLSLSVYKLIINIGDSYILPILTQNGNYRFELVNKVEFSNEISTVRYVSFVSPINYKLFLRYNLVHNAVYKLESKVIDKEPNQPLITENYFPYMTVKVDNKTYIANSKGEIETDDNLNGKNATMLFRSNYLIQPSIVFSSMKLDSQTGETTPILNTQTKVVENNTISNCDDSLIFRIIATHYNGFYKMNDRFCEIDKNFNFLSRDYKINYLCYNDDPIDTTIFYYLANAFSSYELITFFNPLSPKMRFGQMLSVLYHELGHSINNFMYKDAMGVPMQNAALHEGLADIHSAIMLGYPDVFRGASPDGSRDNARNLKNTLKLGVDNIPGENPHFNGQILSGALWDFAELTSMDLMAQLMHFTRYATPDAEHKDDGIAFTGWLKAMLITDDDDGNLKNGTPHFNEIVTAFDNHNINFDTYMQYHYVHTPLKNTDDVSNPYPVKLLIPFVNIIKSVDVWLHFYTSRGLVDSVKMDRSEDEYTAFIPAQPKETMTTYYFKVNSPFSNKYFKLIPYEKTHFFLVDFDLVFEDKGKKAGHTTNSTSSVRWELGNPRDLKSLTPGSDYSGDGICWLIYDFKESQNEQESHLYEADLIFPTVNLNNKNICILELQYCVFTDIVRFSFQTKLFFMLSNDEGETWRTVDSVFAVPYLPTCDWIQKTILINNHFEDFDNIKFCVKAVGYYQNSQKHGGVSSAFIDDIRFWSGGEYIKSITDEAKNIMINITPNPAKTNFIVSAKLDNLNSDITLKISDLAGKVLKEININDADRDFNCTVDTKTLPAGVYIVTLEYAGQVIIKKVIIEK